MLHRWSEFLIRRAGWVLTAGALVTILTAMYGIGVFGSLTQGGFDDPATESARELAHEQEVFGNKSVDVIAIYRSPDLEVSDPDFKAEVDETLARIPEGTTTSVATYWDTRDPSMVSTDKHATTVMISLAGDGQAEQSDLNDELVPTLEADDLETEIAGPWAVYKGVNETVGEDLARAELFSMPLVVILSLLIFGSVVAALMPAVVGAISVLGAMALVRLITSFTEVSVFSINVITLLGTGLAIDYALFVISRFREELAQLPEDDPKASAKAIRVTMATAGRTVLFSGLTVAAAMSSLLIFPQNFLRSLGYGGVAAVLVAVRRGVDRAAGDPDAARPPHRRRPAALATAPSGRGRQRPRRLGADRHGRDAPPGRGDGRGRGCAAGGGLALPQREVGVGRLPRAAPGQPGPRRRGVAERGLRAGALDREPAARDRRTRPRWRRTSTRSRRSTASSTYARSTRRTASPCCARRGPATARPQASQDVVAAIREIPGPDGEDVLVGGLTADTVDLLTSLEAPPAVDGG